MRLYQAIAELADIPGPIVLAIGVFDGIHLGHQAVLRRAMEDARGMNGEAVVVTFSPHPLSVTRPEQAPRLITSPQHRARCMAQLGVRHLLVLPFNAELAALEPEAFVRQLHAACRPLREICVGHTWSFGKNRAGNLELLQRMGEQLGFREVGVPAVAMEGEIVSSTAIRRAIQNGDLARVSRLLGRDFTLLGTVTHGDHIGHTLGFPTANLSTHNEQFPPNGVYAVGAELLEEVRVEAKAKVPFGVSLNEGAPLAASAPFFPGVVNLGVRPSIAQASGERVLELHLPGFNGDLYGRDIEVHFRQFLRAERKFESLDALKTQIARDVAEAQAVLKKRLF